MNREEDTVIRREIKRDVYEAGEMIREIKKESKMAVTEIAIGERIKRCG